MKYKSLKDFEKNGDTIVLLGSGESLNDITKKQWDIILTKNVWALNNHIYHPFIVPNFYTYELKSYDFPIVKERFAEKWDKYKNVKYVLPNNRIDYLKKALPNDGNNATIYVYNYIIRGKHPKLAPEQKINANYDPNGNEFVKSYDASVNLMIDMFYKLGYNKIWLFGFDGGNSRYFWTGGDPIYGKVHHQYNKQHEHNDPNRPHNAAAASVDFIIDFNKRHMIPQGKEILIGSKKSILYPSLKLVEFI
jgi:hypothetical protein